MIDIRQLQLFVAVAEELHFGRAAARVGMAQPPFSQQIRRLERRLGFDLLLRTSRHVALTAAGQAMLLEARDLIARRDRSVDRVRATAAGEAGVLRLGLAASSVAGMLATIVRALRTHLPDVLLRIDDRDGADVAAAVRSGALDVAIVRAPFAATGVVVECVHSEHLIAVLPASHPLAGRPELKPSDLADTPFILFPRAAAPGLYDTIVGVCIDAGFSPDIVQEAHTWLSVVGLVDSGLGVTIAPASAARICPSTVACVPLIGTDGLAEIAIMSSLAAASPLVARFRTISIDALSGLGGDSESPDRNQATSGFGVPTARPTP